MFFPMLPRVWLIDKNNMTTTTETIVNIVKKRKIMSCKRVFVVNVNNVEDNSMTQVHNSYTVFTKVEQTYAQDVHSGRRNGALYGRKRRLKRPETAVYCLNFHLISP